MGRLALLRGPFLERGVAGAQPDADVVEVEIGQRLADIFLEIVGERPQRRDVDRDDAERERTLRLLPHEVIENPKEGREGFAGAGGRADENGAGGEDVGNGGDLDVGRFPELAPKPFGEARLEAHRGDSGSG